ncbi:HET domain-containing protein [Paraphaeosphaeria minitans]|uniref:HET domain-containing protein n=1 Tax=Paraphaeosphaeria minitans TaxID=565426 RepID=A0A9P6KIT4_9PLEO|nr:HET domain-containing protein [Paraphaeosphaeria minitans]
MKNDVKSTLLLLSTIATSVAHNVNATRHGLQPPIHLSTYGKASLQVIDLLQQLKLSYLAAAKDLRWEDRSTGRLVQDTLRQAHDVSKIMIKVINLFLVHENVRLLYCNNNGDLSLTHDLPSGNTIPPYAILSHTWLDNEEVTYDDFIGGRNRDKAGYCKIRYCAQQAKRDGLEYCWVDTCCIDKANQIELHEAISSMFR